MSGPDAAEDLAAELERLRKRIDHVAATVLDEELRAQLVPIRDHLSATAIMLNDSTDEALPRIADRLRSARTLLAKVLRLPGAAR